MQKTEWDQLVKEVSYIECEEYQEEKEYPNEWEEDRAEQELDFN